MVHRKEFALLKRRKGNAVFGHRSHGNMCSLISKRRNLPSRGRFHKCVFRPSVRQNQKHRAELYRRNKESQAVIDLTFFVVHRKEYCRNPEGNPRQSFACGSRERAPRLSLATSTCGNAASLRNAVPISCVKQKLTRRFGLAFTWCTVRNSPFSNGARVTPFSVTARTGICARSSQNAEICQAEADFINAFFVLRFDKTKNIG